MPDSSPKIIMLGTSPHTKGGVGSVIKVYQESGLFSRWPIEYISTHCDGSIVQKMIIALRALAEYVKQLAFGGKFVLHVHASSAASFWRKATFILPTFWTRRPVIFHLHGGGFVNFYEAECGFVGKFLVRYILDRCAKIIVLSDSWRTSLATITSNKEIVTVPNCADNFENHASAEHRDAKSILFLGRLCSEKGIYDLLNAFSLIVRHHPGTRLICAGDGELTRVRRTVAALGLDDFVELPGWVNDVVRTELLSRADVFVLPSYTEGFPMSLLEAMSAGLPVIATPVGGVPEAIADQQEGFLVPAGDIEALRYAIARLLDSPELRERMGRCAREKFEECFSVNVTISRLEAVYRELGAIAEGDA